MGYFANLYLIEVARDDGETVVETNIYGGSVDPRTYFSWGAGSAPKGYYPYAEGTIFSETELKLLKGYPRQETYNFGEPFLLDASFQPRHNDDPVIFHLVLREKYYPDRQMEPFIQPPDPNSAPTVDISKNKIVMTYAVVGGAKISFWVNTLRDGQSLTDFDVVRIVRPEASKPGEVTFKFNAGFFSIERKVHDFK